MPKKRQVFLSHSGFDADRAIALAAALEERLAKLGHRVKVFNTSRPEDRYKDLQQLMTAGEQWQARARQYEEELRAYLTENMERSSAFVALVTRKSLEAGSKVIEFEIDAARSMAKMKQKPFFFPCVTGGAGLGDLPPGAEEFQGLELDAELGQNELANAVHRALSEQA